MTRPNPPLLSDGTQLTDADWCDECQSYLMCDRCANEPLDIVPNPKYVTFPNRAERRRAEAEWRKLRKHQGLPP